MLFVHLQGSHWRLKLARTYWQDIDSIDVMWTSKSSHSFDMKRKLFSSIPQFAENTRDFFAMQLKHSLARATKNDVFLIRVSHRDKVLKLKEKRLTRQLNAV